MTSRSTTSASMASTDITLRVVNAIADIEPATWDACANPAAVPGAHAVEPGGVLDRDLGGDLQPKPQDGVGAVCEASRGVAQTDYNPFISHDFLSALERSGSARNRAGW